MPDCRTAADWLGHSLHPMKVLDGTTDSQVEISCVQGGNAPLRKVKCLADVQVSRVQNLVSGTLCQEPRRLFTAGILCMSRSSMCDALHALV